MTAPRSVVGSFSQSYPQLRCSVSEARRAVTAFARECGFRGQELDDIELAVGEALANAFEHGHREAGSFEVAVRRDAYALTVEVKDDGQGFASSAGSGAARPPAEALRGFGTFIMREVMDEVEYLERGTRVRLRKRFSAESVPGLRRA